MGSASAVKDGRTDGYLRRWLVAAAAFGAALAVPTAAMACPNCPVGQTARQQVCEQDFGTNLTIALLPFLLVGIAAVYAEKIGRAR